MGQRAMNGYFHVLKKIDIFVLCFMCVLTRLSESLNKKTKAWIFICAWIDCTDFIIRSRYIKSGWFTKEISLDQYSIELSWFWSYAIGLYMLGVCIG